jgi:hypothetical protein
MTNWLAAGALTHTVVPANPANAGPVSVYATALDTKPPRASATSNHLVHPIGLLHFLFVFVRW